jgi:hypothetical protein
MDILRVLGGMVVGAGCLLEKASIDEVFIDVTALVVGRGGGSGEGARSGTVGYFVPGGSALVARARGACGLAGAAGGAKGVAAGVELVRGHGVGSFFCSTVPSSLQYGS